MSHTIPSKPLFSATLAILTAFFALSAASTHAQTCQGQWLSGEGRVGAFQGQSQGSNLNFCRWDPDGAGPAPEVVVVAGQFSMVGNTLANNIATFDGTSFAPLGAGFNASVEAVASVDGTLYAFGNSVTASGTTSIQRFSRWNGSAWVQPGTGFSSTASNPCMTSWNGMLILGGGFTSINGTPANYVAAWNGSSWSALGAGLDDQVRSLHIHNGVLHAGGYFTGRVARWDGTTWTSLNSPFTYIPSDRGLATWNGELVAAGVIGVSGGVRRFDGTSWSNIGPAALNATVVATNGADLFAFGALGGSQGNNAYRWTGSAWQQLPTYPYANSAGSYSIGDLLSFSGRLLTGMSFTPGGSPGAGGLWAWDGTSWGPFAPIGNDASDIKALCLHNGEVYCAGQFSRLSGQVIRSVARWDGSQWQPLAPGLRGENDSFANVNGLVSWNGELVAVGSSGLFGSTPHNGAVAWNGSSWRALGIPLDALNGAIVYNGDLIVYGTNVRRWDGNAWQLVGGGVAANSGSIRDAVVFNNTLVIVGDITRAGGPTGPICAGAATWNGSNWSRTGARALSQPRAITTYQGTMFVGETGPGGTGPVLRAWNGVDWDANYLTAFGTFGNTIFDISVVNNQLVVVGNFDSGPVPGCRRVAAWNGTTWRAWDGGLGLNASFFSGVTPNAVLGVGDTAWLVGTFETVGTARTVSAGWARWREASAPILTLEPQGRALCDQSTSHAFITQSTGFPEPSFQWQIEDAPGVWSNLSDGTLMRNAGQVVTITGATATTMSWTDINQDFFDAQPSGEPALRVRCVVTNACGSATTDPATLYASQCDCVDFNNDSLFPDSLDIDDFLSVFSGGLCSNDPNCNDTDFNNDGLFPDTADIDSLLSVFSGGPCL
jgi:trimeric autotransporter adhesin